MMTKIYTKLVFCTKILYQNIWSQKQKQRQKQDEFIVNVTDFEVAGEQTEDDQSYVVKAGEVIGEQV